MKFEMSAEEEVQYAQITHRLAVAERVNAMTGLRRTARRSVKSMLDNCELTDEERSDLEDTLDRIDNR